MDGIEKAHSGASAALDKVASDANMADLDPQQLEEIHKKCKTLKVLLLIPFPCEATYNYQVLKDVSVFCQVPLEGLCFLC